jgi:hypothetical protein
VGVRLDLGGFETPKVNDPSVCQYWGVCCGCKCTGGAYAVASQSQRVGALRPAPPVGLGLRVQLTAKVGVKVLAGTLQWVTVVGAL